MPAKHSPWSLRGLLGKLYPARPVTSLQDFDDFGTHAGANICVAVSHDCDIAQEDLEAEPYVEFIRGRVLDKIDGSKANAKSPRDLHLECTREDRVLRLGFSASEKFRLEKTSLLGHSPEGGLSPNAIRILKIWLAARYNRQAFPDDFDHAMRPVLKQIDKLAQKNSKDITGIFVDFRPRNDSLSGDGEYTVDLSIVHSLLPPDDKALEDAAQALEKKFEGSMDLRCLVFHESGFTLEDLRSVREIRLEHISLKYLDP